MIYPPLHWPGFHRSLSPPPPRSLSISILFSSPPFLCSKALENLDGEDWELSAMICKAAWNLFDDESILNDPVADQMCDTLRDILGTEGKE